MNAVLLCDIRKSVCADTVINVKTGAKLGIQRLHSKPEIGMKA